MTLVREGYSLEVFTPIRVMVPTATILSSSDVLTLCVSRSTLNIPVLSADSGLDLQGLPRTPRCVLRKKRCRLISSRLTSREVVDRNVPTAPKFCSTGEKSNHITFCSKRAAFFFSSSSKESLRLFRAGISSCTTETPYSRVVMPYGVMLPCHCPTWPSLQLCPTKNRAGSSGYPHGWKRLSNVSRATCCNPYTHPAVSRLPFPISGASIHIASEVRPPLYSCASWECTRVHFVCKCIVGHRNVLYA